MQSETRTDAQERLARLEGELARLATERRRGARRRRYLLAAGLAALAAAPFATRALGPLPHVFNAGEPIVAADINENFDHLSSAITELEAPIELCGRTEETDGSISAPGGLVGFPAAGALCRNTCGSESAHMCTADEAQVLAQQGVRERGWVTELGGACNGWTQLGSASALVVVPDPSSWLFASQACTDPAPILCCD